MPRPSAAIHHAQLHVASTTLVSPTQCAAALPYLSHVLSIIPTNLEPSTRLSSTFAHQQQSLCVTECASVCACVCVCVCVSQRANELTRLHPCTANLVPHRRASRCGLAWGMTHMAAPTCESDANKPSLQMPDLVNFSLGYAHQKILLVSSPLCSLT